MFMFAFLSENRKLYVKIMIKNDNSSWKMKDGFSRKTTIMSYKSADNIEFPEITSESSFGYFNIKNALNHSISAVQNSKKKIFENDKQKRFLEMMGQQKANSTDPLSPSLSKSPNPHSIVLVDLMGKDKYKFLKQAGFMNIYTEFNKQRKSKNLFDKNKSFTLSNIKHADKIREYKIKNPTISRNQNYTPLFEKTPQNKKQDGKIDKIENIIKKCDECTLVGKNKIQVPLRKHDFVNDINKMIKNSKLKLMNFARTEVDGFAKPEDFERH
ncbi:hypothetical protein SteCoe_31479 [Stentor coeruleus]|uniref:Uncharacterized protein n=1 Tax=Stentor coeruleus TaxID=5963 RepID=A0A1R2B1F0_9CILI|nr:hypothetical protein SteCoe_31479 [Stentor coeruleus]